MHDFEDVAFTIDGDSNPDGLPGEYAVELLDGQTADHPATLRVTFTNTTEETNEYTFGGMPAPFSDNVGSAEGDGGRLVLLPPDSAPEEPSNGCWEYGQPISQPAIPTEPLDPGETISTTQAILSHEDNDECFPAGNYRFQGMVEVDGTNYEWGFTVSVGVLSET
jgi:hypothetical protein